MPQPWREAAAETEEELEARAEAEALHAVRGDMCIRLNTSG